MKITNVELKINHDIIVNGIREDCKQFEDNKQKTLHKNLIQAGISVTVTIIVFITLFCISKGTNIIGSTFGSLYSGLMTIFVCVSVFKVKGVFNYQYIGKLSNKKKQEIYDYLQGCHRVIYSENMESSDKHKYLAGIPYIYDIIKYFHFMSIIDNGTCAIDVDLNEWEVTIIDTETYRSWTEDIDEWFLETKKKSLTPEMLVIVISSNKIVLYEKGCIDTNLKVDYVAE